jgi:hypothetical protein
MTNDGYPLGIRFIGPEFSTRGVPINDLGQSLITIQRMVNVAYLISTERAFVRASLRDEERKGLALQIVDRERCSDAYLLDWFLRDVASGVSANILADTVMLLAGACTPYIINGIAGIIPKLKSKRPTSKKNKVDFLAVRMYKEFQELANQIGPPGGIESIAITFLGHPEPIIIDEKVKDYVNSIEGTEVPGAKDEYIVGDVDKAYTLTRNCVEINMDQPSTKSKKLVKVCMEGPIFERLLKELTDPKNTRFGFTGQARYKIGPSLHSFNQFEARDFQPAV